MAFLIIRNDLHGIVGISGDRNYLHPVLIRLIYIFHLRELYFAGTAPAGKDVEHHQILLLKDIGKGGCRPVCQSHRKIRYYLPGFNPDPGRCKSNVTEYHGHQNNCQY